MLITTSGTVHSSVALELDPGEGEPDPIKAAVAIPALNPFALAVVKLFNSVQVEPSQYSVLAVLGPGVPPP